METCRTLMLAALLMAHVMVRRSQQVPCYFIFGDSLVDNGNNNHLHSFARADYFPYGIDFPGGPTGRFTNGRTTVDVIGELIAQACSSHCNAVQTAQLLGFQDFILPYATATGSDILEGLNYASAAAGIREETGRQLGARINFTGQVSNFVTTANEIAAILGSPEAAQAHLCKCMYSIGLGSNDYLNNYFMPLLYDTGLRYTLEQYADALLQQYAQQLQVLYDNGARKFALIGLGQIGCSPFQLAMNSPDGVTCVSEVNSANKIFNDKLKAMVKRLNQQMKDAKYIYVDAYGIFEDIVANSEAYGFLVTNAGCCGIGRNNGQLRCMPFQMPCPNRNQYVFWDPFHPSEAANIIIGRRSYKAEKSTDAYPFDISQLAQI